MKIQLLLTGNEIMSGHTVDSNSAMIAEQLANLGLSIYRKVTIGDDFELLVDEIKHLSQHADLVIINGGLGPTVDDLTAKALAAANNENLDINREALSHVEQWCQSRGINVNDANRKQAYLPVSSEIIPNSVGSAVGIKMQLDNCTVLCTPGVPSELKAMMKDNIIPLLDEQLGDSQTPQTLRLQTFGIGESFLQQLVSDQYPNWPEDVELGFRAGMPQLEIKLRIFSEQHLQLQDSCHNWLQEAIGDHIIGLNDSSIAEAVIELLQAKNKRLSCAESCTGGLIASMITQIPGSSKAFEAGVVSYSNESKSALLGLDSELIKSNGAVSEAVVRAMANNVMSRTNTDYAIVVSGIAGPDGGTEEKPVGTVCIAWGAKGKIKTTTLLYPLPRQWFQSMIAAIALDLLRRDLLAIEQTPRYLKRYQRAEQ